MLRSGIVSITLLLRLVIGANKDAVVCFRCAQGLVVGHRGLMVGCIHVHVVHHFRKLGILARTRWVWLNGVELVWEEREVGCFRKG